VSEEAKNGISGFDEKLFDADKNLIRATMLYS